MRKTFQKQFCVYVCSCSCVYSRVRVIACVHRGQQQGSSPSIPHIGFWDRDSHWTWRLPIHLACLANKAAGILWCLPLQDRDHRLFTWKLGIKLDPQAYTELYWQSHLHSLSTDHFSIFIISCPKAPSQPRQTAVTYTTLSGVPIPLSLDDMASSSYPGHIIY